MVNYGRLFSATFSAPQSFSNWRASSSGDIGSFNGGAGNIGAFNGLWNASATSGNNNIGVFNGLGNGGVYDGNGNVGAFNGNLNGLADSSPSDGGGNGDGNVGAFDGNFNGNFVQGTSSGNNNGLDNIGFLSGNWNGNGQAPAATPVNLLNPALQLTGGFDTAVLGNGDNTVVASAGLSTLVAGNGDNHFTIGGNYDTVDAGDGSNTVTGVGVNFAVVTLGNGSDTVNLTGSNNTVKTGAGNDVINVTGSGDLIDAGTATTFNLIHASQGGDTFMLDPGAGYDKIFGFTLSNHDTLNLSEFATAGGWDGKLWDLSQYFVTIYSGGDTFLDAKLSNGGLDVVADLVGVHASLALISHAIVG